MAKQTKIKEVVRLRAKKLANGNESLYLDCYVDGKRTYEFLKLYLIPGSDANAKRLNKETMAAANAIKAKRIIEVANGAAGIKQKNEKVLLFDWIDETIKGWQVEFNGSFARLESVRSMRHYMVNFLNGKKTFVNDVDTEFCRRFSQYLQASKPKYHKEGETLSRNSCRMYFTSLKVVLQRAVVKGLLATNPVEQMEQCDKPKAEKSERSYLTTAEFKRLIETPMTDQHICGAFAFCCLTGLRLSDVETLRWDEIDFERGEICKRMRKTGDVVTIPLSETAKRFLPHQSGEFVFNLASRTYMGSVVRGWAKTAKITKPISWHTSRHTFATMSLEQGGDLYAISKILGHSSVAVTEIYATLLDKQKQKAVSVLDDALMK